MRLVGKVKEGSRPGGGGAKARAHAPPQGPPGPLSSCGRLPRAHAAPMSSGLLIFSRKAGNPDFFFFLVKSLDFFFKCWQLIENLKKHPAGQTKHIHRLNWPTGCQLLASGLKEMGRTRSKLKNKNKKHEHIQSFPGFPSTTGN